jgi:glycosyltransferase involved in cell wall biosynthesis
MKKIVNIVLNNFRNDSRVLKTSVSLQGHGFDVQVVALHDANLAERERIRSIKVDRIRLFTRKWPKNKLVQLIKYFEFMFRVVKNYRHTDIVHCNDLNTLPVGLMIKLLGKGVKVVYDAHEFEIDDIPNQSAWAIKFKYWIEKSLICYVNRVITVSESIATEYVRLYSIPKPALVLNCPAYQDVLKKNLFREDLKIRENQTIFLYQGNLSYGRGIELLLEAFDSFDSDKNVLVCMGYGPLEQAIKRRADACSKIYFFPASSPDNILDYTASANYGIAFIEDTCLSHRYCLPNKMFEYLMAGIPVLTSNLFEMKRLVESYKVGIVADDNTVDGVKRSVEASLLQNYHEIRDNLLRVKKEFCWENQEKILLDVYRAL